MSARSPGVKRGRKHPDAEVAVRGFEHPAAGCLDGLYNSFRKVLLIHYIVKCRRPAAPLFFGPSFCPAHIIRFFFVGEGGGLAYIFLLLSSCLLLSLCHCLILS